MAAALLVVFLSVSALVIDHGVILAERSIVSKAVDAAALAGAQELPDQVAATAVATNYVGMNGGPGAVPNITFPGSNVIRVAAGIQAPALFSRVLGLTDFTVSSIAEATRFDPYVAIIMDRSGSMCDGTHLGITCPPVGPWEPFNTVQQIAKDFVDQFRGNPVFTLISFSTTATLDAALTSNREQIKAAIDGLKPLGSTDIAAGLETSITQLLQSTGRNPNLIVLMTDGLSNVANGVYYGDFSPVPREALINAATRAHDNNMTIYGINYGPNVDDDLMRQVAETTEGKFYSAPNNTVLQSVYSEIGSRAYIALTNLH